MSLKQHAFNKNIFIFLRIIENSEIQSILNNNKATSFKKG